VIIEFAHDGNIEHIIVALDGFYRSQARSTPPGQDARKVPRRKRAAPRRRERAECCVDVRRVAFARRQFGGTLASVDGGLEHHVSGSRIGKRDGFRFDDSTAPHDAIF
jgi:hypothetical protein